MFSSLLSRIGLSSAPSAASSPPPPSENPLSAGAHVWCLAQDTSGDLLFAGDAAGAIHVWRARDNTYVGALNSHDGTVYALLPRATTLVSAGADGLRTWRLSGAALPTAGSKAEGTPGAPVLALAGRAEDPFSEHVYSSGADGKVMQWTIAENGTLSSEVSSEPIAGVTFYQAALVELSSHNESPRGPPSAVACASSDGELRLWRADNLQLLCAIPLEVATATNPTASPSISPASLSFFCIAATLPVIFPAIASPA